jgi:hypothetical protein
MTARVDRNHWDVFSAFKRLGWCAISTHALGSGFPDMVVAKAGVLKLVEVKDGKKSKSRRPLTPDQVIYHRDMAAAGCPVVLITSLDDVVALDRALTQRSAQRRPTHKGGDG